MLKEFIVATLAILVGFVLGKQISVLISKSGVPIASGDVAKVPLGSHVVAGQVVAGT